MTHSTPRVEIIGVTGLTEIRHGDALGKMLFQASETQGTPISEGDIVLVTQKIVSKAEGRTVDLRTVQPSERARQLASESGRDPRLLEIVLRESAAVVRMDKSRGVLITETKHGFVCANAGVDTSNVPGTNTVSLLPEDPDGSARSILRELCEMTGGARVAVILTDTFGRAWRNGHVNFAIGVAGMDPLLDYRGTRDALGHELSATRIAVADELAAASELVMGKSEAVPVAIVRGYRYDTSSGGVSTLIRERSFDLFR